MINPNVLKINIVMSNGKKKPPRFPGTATNQTQRNLYSLSCFHEFNGFDVTVSNNLYEV
jgi:hypothetical protein